MRVVLASYVFVLIGCAGSPPKPAESPSNDTASLESSTTPSTSAASAAPSAKDSNPPPSHDAVAASPPSGAPAASPGAFHPLPSATGSIDGKPFAPKLARISAPLQKDGRVLITLSEGTDCSDSSAAKPGDGSLTMVVPWQDGYKVDLASLKRGTKKGTGEIAFVRTSGANKSEVSPGFKPSGTVTILSAPMERNATGKMKIDLQSGDYMLAGDLDIQVCVSPK